MLIATHRQFMFSRSLHPSPFIAMPLNNPVPPPPPSPPCRLSSILSYASTLAIVVCLFSAGYIIFAYASPAYKRRRSRREYDIIAGGTTTTNAANSGAYGGGGGAGGAAPNAAAVSGAGAGAAAVQPGSEGVGGVLGRGWRAYGSTDEAPAGAGCLPPTAGSS